MATPKGVARSLEEECGFFFYFASGILLQVEILAITKFISWFYIRFLFLGATPVFNKPQILFYSLIHYLYSERNYEMNVVTHLSTIYFIKPLIMAAEVSHYIKNIKGL